MIVTRRHLLFALAAVPVVGFAAKRGGAASSRIYNTGGIAIDGSDTVAYFTQGRPVAGDVTINHNWNGARWHFSTVANRDAFAADPEAFAPQYGGYCAWSMTQGSTAPTVPEAWGVVDGKLYLNYSSRIQRRWDRNIPGYIALADEIWPSIKLA